MSKNVGKQFEENFINSIKAVPYCWHKRLNDNASSWSGGSKTRFASTNECDFLLFDCKTLTLSALELKSFKDGGSLTFWREDFESEEKQTGYNIKKSQINGMAKWLPYQMNCGFIFNIRNESNDTYFVMLDDFLKYTSALDKKSINEKDILGMNPIKIESKKMKTNYRYNVEKFLKEIHL